MKLGSCAATKLKRDRFIVQNASNAKEKMMCVWELFYEARKLGMQLGTDRLHDAFRYHLHECVSVECGYVFGGASFFKELCWLYA